MRHKRLATLIQTHQAALLTHAEAWATHGAIISLLHGVGTGEITAAQCARLLRCQSVLVAGVPAFAVLYRQAAADIRQVQREER